MSGVLLPCVMVGEACDYKTPEGLPYEQAKEVLELHMRHVHPVAGGGAGREHKPEKFPRPTLELDSTIETWQEFHSTFEEYKKEYGLTGASLVRQLIACCSADLKTSLSRLTGGKHFSLSEKDLLSHMKTLAVRYQNPAVYVQEFLSLAQQPEESVRHYLSRLTGVGSRCNFSVECSRCNTPVSYSDKVVRFKLIAGLVDGEI